MPEDFLDKTVAQIRRAFHFTFNFWRCGVYGVDGGTEYPLKVNTDGEIDVNVISGGSTTAVGLATVVGTPVDATGLGNDSTWTNILTNGSSVQAKKVVIRNWCDKWIEVAFTDTPTTGSGNGIEDYISPWTVHEFSLKSDEGYLDGDISARRFDGTPSLGYVQATIYYDA